MTNYDENIDYLIGKVLSGEATHGELTIVELWRALSEENETYFAQMKRLHEQSNESYIDQQFDTQAAWRKVSARISLNEATGQVISMPSLSNRIGWRIAATVVILIGIGTVLFLNPYSADETYALIATDAIQKDTLIDGTETTLNKNSQITYTYNKKKKQREVSLSGEAFFKIAENDEAKFVVTSEELLIEDIGTAFNVRAQPGDDTAYVFVEEGLVKMYTAQKEGIEVRAGETGKFVRSKGEFIKQTAAENSGNHASYATKKFKFRNASLSEVLRDLNEVYGSQIILSNEKLNDCRISVNFDGQDINTILQVIAESLGYEVKEENGKLVLVGEDC